MASQSNTAKYLRGLQQQLMAEAPVPRRPTVRPEDATVVYVVGHVCQADVRNAPDDLYRLRELTSRVVQSRQQAVRIGRRFAGSSVRFA